MNQTVRPATLVAGANIYPSARARIVERRTYLRPLNEGGTVFETPAEMLERVIAHQRWLWENQVKRPLELVEEAELAELRQLIVERKASMSGRVKWMGGTDLVKERASAAFNCSFTTVQTPADLVDVFWLLLQGCGVGFKPIPGLMTGFSPSLKAIDVIGSNRQDKGGAENNKEEWNPESGEWIITVGDSAKAWAKAFGKIMAGKYPAKRLVLDLSELRPGGKRLKGYGWLSSGWQPLAKAFKRIGLIMMKAANRVLTSLEIGEIINWLGTVLSSRRSAQIWLQDDISDNVEGFVDFKVDRFTYYRKDGSIWEPPADFDWSQHNAVKKLDALAATFGAENNVQREQSNNSVLFWSKPTRERIVDLLKRILPGGDPGFINAAAAKRRAPDFEGCNPCAEILFSSKGFCNLVQTVWHRFNGNFKALVRAQYIAGRANYRQTCVSMKDGVLQLGWNDTQHLLRLCGVAPLGYVSWEFIDSPLHLESVAKAARDGANSMADEFGTPRPRRVTQVQPGGTSSKHLGLEGDEVHEGAHLSLSRWIFNNMNITKGEPLVDALKAANYHIFDHPTDPTAVIVRIPVEYPESPLFTKTTMKINGRDEQVEVNMERAVSQLNRYKTLMKHYVDHNCSITISFEADEIEDMADWFMENWDNYVGVSFLRRNDPTKTAADLGFAYLPQEAVSKRMFDEYVATLLPLDLSNDNSQELIDMGDCATGACPIR
ncbi:MAG: ribonucleoside-triphosphate reductase, adenosylcobalamin-dependent [Mesorhizobium sp.]|nr:MAG: ribonucleoside-triphosphate reductase, adenosylcobalamin-dependent [Mesorhizobium sp.]